MRPDITRTEGAKRPVKTVETAFLLLEHLKEAEGDTLAGMTGEFDMAKSTIHRHLGTLQQLGYVVEENGVYHPSMQFLDFGEYTQTRKIGYAMAEQKVAELAEQTDERAQFLVEEHGVGVYVHRATGANAVMTDPGIGKWNHLHTISAGKAILAHLPEETVEEIIDTHGLPRKTANTITDREELLAQLATIREREYSINREEDIDGVNAVGVPVFQDNDEILGALSVSGPSHRMKGEWFEETLPDLLLGIANELELNIIHS
ncbi:IclR family transcriptional regulator [Halobacteriales archaeon Cl-PHB]